MNPVFVTVALSERYQPLAERQRKSFGGKKAQVIQWLDRLPPGTPEDVKLPHQAYCAKPFAMLDAFERGFNPIVWIDAAYYLLADPEPLFGSIADKGYYVQENGWSAGQWCSDAALKTLGITREQSILIPEISGSMIGLDIRAESVGTFLQEWARLAKDGITFHGPHTNDIGPAEDKGVAYGPVGRVSDDPRVYGHRWDQTAASVLAWRRQWKPTPRPIFADYWRIDPDEQTILVNRG